MTFFQYFLLSSIHKSTFTYQEVLDIYHIHIDAIDYKYLLYVHHIINIFIRYIMLQS